MANCKEISELMSLYIDGELDESKRIDFEEHIKECNECKKELDEVLRVIAVCKEITDEELPERFKEDLHKKLLQEKEKQAEATKTVSLRNKYIRICSSIAAVLVIALLMKGLLGNIRMGAASNTAMDASPKTQAAKSEEKYEMKAAEAPKAAENNTTVSSIAGVEDKAAYTLDGALKADSIKPEEKQKQSQNSGFTAMKKSGEVLENRLTNIVIKSEKPENIENNIKTIAISNGAVFAEASNAVMDTDLKAQSVYGGKEDSIVMNFKIPLDNYSRFEGSIKAAYPGLQIELSPIRVEDEANTINGLNDKLNGIEAGIKSAESDKDNSNPDDMNRLKSDRDATKAEIERIKEDTGYVQVVLSINKK